MADSVDKIIEEVKALEEKPFHLTKAEASALLSCVSLTAAVMASDQFRHLLIMSPALMFPVALVRACDPKAEHAEALALRLAEFLDPELASEAWAEKET